MEDSAHSETLKASKSDTLLDDTLPKKKSLIVVLPYGKPKVKTMDFRSREIINTQLSCLESGAGSDFEVECQGRTWKVHRGLLGQRYDYFRAAAQSELSEQSNEVIKMDSDDPKAINVVLEYIYTASDRTKACNGFLADLENHDELSADLKHLTSAVIAADMCLLPKLVELFSKKINIRISRIGARLMQEDKYVTKKLFSGLLEAPDSNRDCVNVQFYCSQFLETIMEAKGNITETFVT